MFYEHKLLKPGRKYSTIWIASNFGTTHKRFKLTLRDIRSVNIVQTCDDLINPTPSERMALRLQAMLLFGTTRIYAAQVNSLYNDVHTFQKKFLKSLVPYYIKNVDLPGNKRSGNVTLPDPQKQYFNGDFETVPTNDIFNKSGSLLIDEFFTMPITPEWPSYLNQADPKDITMTEPEIPVQSEFPASGDDDDDEFFGEENEPPVDNQFWDKYLKKGKTENGGEGDDAQQTSEQPTAVNIEDGEIEDEGQEIEEDVEIPRTDIPRIGEITPEPPKKTRRKRRQPFDWKIQLSAETIRENMRDTQANLRDSNIHVCDPTKISVAELFNNPACRAFRAEPFFHLWKRCNVKQLRSSSEIEREEPDTVIPRDESDLESSKHTLPGLDVTPGEVPEQEPLGLSPDPTRAEDISIEPSSVTQLPTIEEVELELVEEEPFEQIYEIPQLDDFKEQLLRRVKEMLTSGEEVTVRNVIPPPVNKRSAAKTFVQCLAWHKEGVINLEQDGSFQEIRIKKGARF